MAFGEKFLVSPIAEYASLYPEVMVDIEFNDKRVNLIEEDYDLVIRIGSLDDSGLIAKKLCDLSLYLCASPKFIEEHGIPAEPADLRALPFVCYRDSSTGFNLSYKSPNGIQRSLSTKPVIYANSLEMLVESSLRGLGYAQLPSFAIRRHLENGDLIQLLSNYACLPEISMYALYADRRFLPLKVRKLIDLLSTHFQST
jgi:DNA-binding transcriptional LysR family regulator